MIEFLSILSAQGERQVRQLLVSPSVYLDTWAIREFSENDILGARFRAALLKAKGTLVLSDINLVDFSAFEDSRHSLAAGRFVDTIIPHLFLAQFEPFEVIRRELEIMVRRTDQSPAGDEQMLRIFAEEAVERGGIPSAAAWFGAVYKDRSSLRSYVEGLAAAFYAGLQALRHRYDTEPDFRRGVLMGVESAERPRSTLALMRAIFEVLQADRKLPEDPNSAIDLFHSLVPAAYCDFVLVDSQWEYRLSKAKTRLSEAGITTRVATPFSKKGNGTLLFLEAIEAWQVSAKDRAELYIAGTETLQ